MSHRSRTYPTHTLTAERRAESGTDEFGEPIFDDTTTPVEDEPVRYRPAGTGFVRQDTGERVTRLPTVTGRRGLVEELQEGDDVTLTPLDADIDEVDGQQFEIVSVEGRYGRRAGPGIAVIALEAI